MREINALSMNDWYLTVYLTSLYSASKEILRHINTNIHDYLFLDHMKGLKSPGSHEGLSNE